MGDIEQDEIRALIRAAVERHDEVAEVKGGPRHNEFGIRMKDGRYRVVAIAVRDFI